jgi:hypothetical protein
MDGTNRQRPLHDVMVEDNRDEEDMMDDEHTFLLLRRDNHTHTDKEDVLESQHYREEDMLHMEREVKVHH